MSDYKSTKKDYVIILFIILLTIFWGVLLQKWFHPLGVTVQLCPAIYAPATTKTSTLSKDDEGRIIEIIRSQTFYLDTTVKSVLSDLWFENIEHPIEIKRIYSIGVIPNRETFDTIYPCGDSI